MRTRDREIKIRTEQKVNTIPIVSSDSIQKSIKSYIFSYLIYVQSLHDSNSSLSINATNVDKEIATMQNNNLILEGNSKVEGIQEGFLKQYQDCFADSLPSELPPARGQNDRRIDLIPGSVPPNGPPYRVSRAQQEEIMTQV